MRDDRSRSYPGRSAPLQGVGLARKPGTPRCKPWWARQKSAEVVVPIPHIQCGREGPNDEEQGGALARLDASGAPRRPRLRARSRRPQVHCPDRDVPRRRCARNHALGCLPEFRRTAARDDPNIEAASAGGTTAPDFQPLSNRLVRTRMPGGVGGGRRKPPAYPIPPALFESIVCSRGWGQGNSKDYWLPIN